MDEVKFISVSISKVIGHGLGPPGNENPDIGASKNLNRLILFRKKIGSDKVGTGKGAGPTRALNSCPSRRRMGAV